MQGKHSVRGTTYSFFLDWEFGAGIRGEKSWFCLLMGHHWPLVPAESQPGSPPSHSVGLRLHSGLLLHRVGTGAFSGQHMCQPGWTVGLLTW